ncbi:FabD/lysophospholipase-like protein [Mycena venus]|uniref:FabD/lysophospholipase-like protein n=1 Tax=Mycena venus TaxID=2733690 RepID=A0A8H6XMM5_9AGAR|nr:FabD/lysophospholipase-like protein [Mycena venus]
MHHFFTSNTGIQLIYVLHGLGGAGKTQIALKFIQESLSRFSDIFYIDTSTIFTIETGLKNIAVVKDFGDSPQDGLLWLTSKVEEWLLLFDNADDPKINLNSFFPQCNHGNIVITSRNPGLCVYAGSHALISDMEEPDAVDLLLTSAAQKFTASHKDMAAEIVRELSCLPLAIIQAGAFIAESGALNRYLALFKQNQARLLRKKPAQSHDDYGSTVYTTWQISFSRLGELAATLLQLCSFLHHQGISEKIFSYASAYQFQANGPSEEELSKPMELLSQFLDPTGAWDSLQFMEVTNELQAYSLINFNMETGYFSIHPLVHSWSQSTLADGKMYHESMVAVVGMSIAGIHDDDFPLASLWLLPHVDRLIQGTILKTPYFNSDFGEVYFFSGRWQDAQICEAVAFEKYKEILGEDHPDTLSAMGALAWTYNKLGQLDRAKELEVVVLEKQKRILGEDHLDTLTTMSKLAWIYKDLGQWTRAEELGAVVFQKLKKVLGEDHLNTLCIMSDLAWIYESLGQSSRAEELGTVVVGKYTKILGEAHPYTLASMSNLASTYDSLGQSSRAEKLGSIVLEKRKKILGEDHPDTLLTMSNLAEIYESLGQSNRAVELGAVLLEKRKKILGEEHPETLTTMGNLAWSYQCLGQLTKAEELGSVVLEMYRKILGEEHSDTLASMNDLARIYQSLGQFTRAEELGTVVLEKYRKVLGEEHPYTLTAMSNLASMCQSLGQSNRAEELGAAVLEKQKIILGEDHPDTLKTMSNLALTYRSLGQSSRALELGAVVLQKQKKILGEDHRDTLKTMNNLAFTYESLGQSNRAAELGAVVLEKRRKILGEDHPDTLWTMKFLHKTYQALGKLDEVASLSLLIAKIEGSDN